MSSDVMLQRRRCSWSYHEIRRLGPRDDRRGLYNLGQPLHVKSHVKSNTQKKRRQLGSSDLDYLNHVSLEHVCG